MFFRVRVGFERRDYRSTVPARTMHTARGPCNMLGVGVGGLLDPSL
jgi:hypothetical protein